MTASLEITKPQKVQVPIATGLAWGNDGSIYQKKADGVFSPVWAGGNLLATEWVKADGVFYAFDMLVHREADDISNLPFGQRFSMLLKEYFSASDGVRIIPWSHDGGKLLREVLAAGEEGVCRKLPDSTYYTPFEAAKRIATWQCVVTGFVPHSQSVTIADRYTGEDRGRVALLGGKCLKVRVGSILKVEGFELTARGKIREPRVCKDNPNSWLIQY